MKKEMLINVLQSEECRIAIIEDGVLEELYVERTSHETYTGNIYKGRIVNLEPAIQAAFVDFSIGRNGFLHVSDVEPRYYRRHLGEDVELGGRDRGRDPRRTARPGEPEAFAPSPPAAVPGGRGVRPPRSDRGRREREDRRPAPASPSAYPPVSGYGQMPLDYPASASPEVFEDFVGSEVPTQRAPRPEAPRERPRRGVPGRDRTTRPSMRDREPIRPPEIIDIIDVDLDLDTDPPPRRTPVVHIEPVFEPAPVVVPEIAEIAPPTRGRRFAADISEPVPPPAPPVHVAPSDFTPEVEHQPPPTPPNRPRRAFGAGLEDWDNRPSSSSRHNLKSGQSKNPRSTAGPDSDDSMSSVTHHMSPAPPNRPSQPKRPARFGSGLIDDSDLTDPRSTPEASNESAFEASERSRRPSDARRQPAEPTRQSPESEDSEAWSDFTPLEPVAEPFASDISESESDDQANRGRGRRRTSPDRSRGRARRTSDPSAEPVAEFADPSEFDESGDELAPDPSTVDPRSASSTRNTRGRDAIRGRGGNRESRGPRPPVIADVEASWEPAGTENPDAPGRVERPASRPVDSRYVPRLERERRSSKPAGPASREFGRDERSVNPDPDFESIGPELTDTESDTGFDTTTEQDPRLNPRGRDNKNRRRRRRRRPDEREIQPGESLGSDSGDEFENDLETSAPEADTGAWAELDWSSSPGGNPLADLESDEEAEADSEVQAPRQQRPRPSQPPQRRNFRRRPMHDMGPAPGEDSSDDMDDEFGDSGHGSSSYTIDPNDIVEPELEEEIRREAEEIAALEIELGIRQPGEIRESPRSGMGASGGRSAGLGGGRGFYKPPIQEVFQRSDEVLVQVIKESLGTKGPTLSTYISIPGRYLVLMPGLNRVGVSRKIADEGQRRKLRDLMNQLNPPKGLGFIVRTAGVDRSKRELARDLAYLLRLWKTILRRIKRTKSPAPIYQESDMIIRTIRDIFNSEIDTIWIDEPAAFERAQEFLKNVMPKFVDRLKLYEDKTPLFHKYGIEDEIARIGQRHVPLPDGGSIVIDQTEALVAIDVNSGNFRVDDDAERTAYEMNLRAAKEIARQLRLRDLGGVIVNDFIDMRDERHRRGVERALRDAIRRDRARTKILRMSQFGLIEMTRQRIRPSIKRSIYEDCPNCQSQGVVKSAESMAIEVMRILALSANRQDIRRVNISCSHNVANFLNNRKRQDLARLERDSHLTIHIRPEENVAAEFLQIDGYGNYNTEIRLYPTAAMISHRRVPNTTSNAPAHNQGSGHGHNSSHHHGHSH